MKVILKVQSGLCNRLIPFITGINLSIDMNASFYLYWDDKCRDLLYKYQGENTTYEHMFEYYNNINYITKNEFDNYLNSTKDKLVINFNSDFNYNKNYLSKFEYIIFNDYYYPIFLNDDQNKFTSYSDKFIFNKIWHNKISKLFQNLKIKKNLNLKINKFDNSELIGIHLRHNEKKWAEKNKINEYDFVKKLVQKMYQEIKLNKNIKFFISTSNKNILQKLENIFNNKIIYFFERLGNPKIDFFYNNDSEKDSCTLNKNLNGLIDLILLSQCKKIYCKKSSSFSTCAYLMNCDSELIIL